MAQPMSGGGGSTNYGGGGGRYKTRLCLNFERTGQCPRGETCSFAHGQAELRSESNPQYNTNNNNIGFAGGGGGGQNQNQNQQQQQRRPKAPSKPKAKAASGGAGGGGYSNQQQQQQNSNNAAAGNYKGPWLPPGADFGGTTPQNPFGKGFDPAFVVPTRLRDKSADLVGAVNDFHYAMVNDLDRNEFYRCALEQVIDRKSKVLEIGTGSGLLAMLAAQLGAEWVIAVEANRDMAELARQNIAANGFSDRITVLNMLSTDLRLRDLPSKPTVLVSELFGTLLMGESALEYISDCRRRLLAPDAKIVPPAGRQFATLIECKDLEAITSVTEWGGLNLSHLNSLQDTVSIVFTKQYGFRLSSVPHRAMAERLTVLDVDFAKNTPECAAHRREFPIQVQHTGVIHAVMLSWEAYAAQDRSQGPGRTMSTDPVQTSFARDLQWGQALQLVEDLEAGHGQLPVPYKVTAGEWLKVVVRYSEDWVLLQFELQRMKASAGGGDAMEQ